MNHDGTVRYSAAVIYHAIEDGEDAASNEVLVKLRQRAHERRWRTVSEYIDYHCRNAADSFEYDRLISDAHQRRFDLVLFQSLSVLCPGGCRDAVTDLSRLFQLGIGVNSLEEPELDTTAAYGPLAIGLINSLARLERQHVSRRITRGMGRARRRGKKLGRPELPRELQRDIAQQRRAGKSLTEIADDLGISTSTALKYSRPAIDLLLRRR